MMPGMDNSLGIPMNTRPLAANALRVAAAALIATAAGHAAAEVWTLNPAQAGQFVAGTGVDATFLKVADNWHGSSVLWDEASGSPGSGQPIGSFAWGTGLWGLADFATANGASPPAGMIETSWSGRVGQIAFADDAYNQKYASSWGAVALAPLFGLGTSSQDNWTSSAAGYIRITQAGIYNFSVLYDDGFQFRLGGAGGQVLELREDFLNPRDRLGFASDLALQPGLYAFELGGYDRLETGVLQLDWRMGSGEWSPIPTANLVAIGEVTPVPEPGTTLLFAAGLLALGGTTLHRRRTRPA